MRDLRLSLRNTRLLLRRSRAFGLFVAVGTAFVLLCGALVAQAARTAEHEVLESSIMRTIEVSGVGVSRPIDLTQERIGEISRIAGVASVQPWVQSGCMVTESPVEVPGALWATPRMAVGQPPIVSAVRPQPLPLRDDEVILPAHVQGADLSRLLGKEITVEYTRRVTMDSGEAAHVRLRVVGLYDEAIGGRDGPAATYLSEKTAFMMAAAREGVPVAALGGKVGYPKVIVEVARAGEVARVQRALSDLGYNASSVQAQLKSLPPAVGLISTLGNVMTGALVLVCLAAGLTIGAGLVRARVREIGLLKALGFGNGRVAKLFALELGAFGLFAGFCGVAFGLLAFVIAQRELRGETVFDVRMAEDLVFPSALRVGLLMLAPAVAMLVGGALPLARAAALAPDVALREPA